MRGVLTAALVGLLGLGLGGCGASAALRGFSGPRQVHRAAPAGPSRFEGSVSAWYAHVLSQMRRRGQYSAGVWHPVHANNDQDQVIGNYAPVLMALHPPG